MTSHSNSGGVCAVIVTYNRLNLLKKCLEGVRSQTRPPDRIVVVNNASTDGTAGWLASVPGIAVVNQNNSGSSGGQAAGFRWAHDHGCSWIWCCDDDVRPKPDALSRMLDVGSRHQACVLTLKQFDDGAVQQLKNHFCPSTAKRLNRPPVFVEPGIESVNFGNFEGMLIPRRVVDAIGLPDRRFFVCGDDIIYGFLASRTGPVLLHRKPLFEKLLPRPPVKPKWNIDLPEPDFHAAPDAVPQNPRFTPRGGQKTSGTP